MSHAAIGRNFARLPLAFEPNRGQVDPRVHYLTRGRGYTMFFTAHGPVMALSRGAAAHRSHAIARGGVDHALSMSFVGARRQPSISGAGELRGRVNYLVGRDPSRWHRDIPTFARVDYEHVWNGVSAVFYGHNGRLEYDFRVAAGADPRRIALRFAGARSTHVARDGSLVLALPGGGSVRELAPHAYQVDGRVRRSVRVAYAIGSGGLVHFKLGGFDRSRPLTIDPALAYASYIGGSNAAGGGGGGSDEGTGIAVDSSGSAYVTGVTNSSDFPHTNGALKTTNADHDNLAFVSKLAPDGTSFVYSTYLGGTQSQGNSIAVDSSGRASVTGWTQGDFPITTATAYQTTSAAGSVFVTRLKADGSALDYSTFLGQDQSGEGNGIAVDASGVLYVTGLVSGLATSFPSVHGLSGLSSGGDDAFVAKIDPSQSGASSLVYSTRLGGSGDDDGHGIAVDSAGNAYVAGTAASTDFKCSSNRYSCTLDPGASSSGLDDAFISKLSFDSSTSTLTLPYSTLLGGDSYDDGFGVAADSSGNAYVTGDTQSTSFPTKNGYETTKPAGHSIFVTKLNTGAAACSPATTDPCPNSLAYGTYLDDPNNTSNDHAQAIALDPSNHAFVTGSTDSSGFPHKNSIQTFNKGLTTGNPDAFVSEIDTTLTGASSLLFSTFLGGSDDEFVGNYAAGNDVRGNAIAVDTAGNPYVTGTTFSADFPVGPNPGEGGGPSPAQATFGSHDNDQTTRTPDAYVAKIQMPRATTTSVTCTPNPVEAGVPVTCTFSVTDASSPGVSGPTGLVFYSTFAGEFSKAHCSLVPAGATVSRCQATFTEASAGTKTIAAHYNGDPTNLRSDGSYQLQVEPHAPPTITMSSPTNGAHYKQGQNVAAQYACTDQDGDNDVSLCGGPAKSGSPIDTSTPGKHTFTVQASDEGTTVTKTVSYTVDTTESSPPAVHGLPQDQGCVSKGFKLHVSVHPTRLKRAVVFLDGSQIATSKKPDFTVKISKNRLGPGRHHVKILREYKSGTKRHSTFSFLGCRKGGRSPHIHTEGTPDRGSCTAKPFKMLVSITHADVKTILVKLDGKQFAKPGKAQFTLSINVRKLKAGPHKLTISAADKYKNGSVSITNFVRCG